MHIGLVTASYLPIVNGVTRMVALYKKHFEAAGHQVTVFTLGDAEEDGNDPNIVRSPGLALSKSGYYFALRYSQKAQELLSRVDIIHCHHLIMGLEFAQRYGRSPIVYTNHTRYDLYAQSYMRFPDPIARGFLRLLWPRMTGYCDVVVAPSASAKRLLRTFGVTQTIEVIENGIELEHYRNPNSPLRKQQIGVPQSSNLLVYIGRLAGEKNLETLLYEFSLAFSEAPSLRLLFVGAGPAERKLRQLARKLRIAEQTVFVGAVPHHEIPRYLAAADIFVTASQSEVLPLTIIEAMAAGLPVLAIESPGVNDLIQTGQTGILTGNKNGDLAHGILLLTNNSDERRRLAYNAYQASRYYHIDRTVRLTIQLYKRLLNGTGRIPAYEGRDAEMIHCERPDSKSYDRCAFWGLPVTTDRKKLGEWGESVAALHLQAKGYEIVDRNWRTRLGEIDIVARERDGYIFVEVKTRRGRGMGSPEEGLTRKKSSKLIELGLAYMAEIESDADWRIDLVAVEIDMTGKLIRCEHVPNVVLGW